VSELVSDRTSAKGDWIQSWNRVRGPCVAYRIGRYQLDWIDIAHSGHRYGHELKHATVQLAGKTCHHNILETGFGARNLIVAEFVRAS
jgi:hypothetical protein